MSDFNYEIVKNPRIFEQNRMAAHSDHEYSSINNFKYSLNGSWKFTYACHYRDCNVAFTQADTDCKNWKDIKVPGHIQMQGYDQIAYINYQYPWDGIEDIEPGEIPDKENPVGCYVKYFNVPEYMQNGPVYISFQGVESAVAVWLNGKYVGYSEDSFTPSEFDLTPYIKDGENKLALMVFKYSAGSWCEDQDFFRFFGIFRDVYLYTIPKTHVRDLRIQTLLDDDYKNGKLVLDMDVIGEGRVNLVISDENSEITKDFDISAGKNHFEMDMLSPSLWSAEKPNLYDLSLNVFCKDELCEVVEESVGFRRFELINKVMHINGKRIVFKGTNRHEFSSASGRVLSLEDIEKDIITIKQNNINAIRCSHYPNQTGFYRLCDKYGIYVIDETNLETHGTWMTPIESKKLRGVEYAVPGDRPEYTDNVIDRAHSMFERDKNHPSILLWSLGNESFGGLNLKKMHDKFKEWDSTRLVHYEGICHDRRYPDTSDVESTMYPPAAAIKDYLKEHRDKPYINCEYAHAMGNSCGAMNKYTELAYEDELFQGGFIWDYIDQAITTKNRYGEEFEGYGGDFGERPHDGSFSGDGLCYSKDRKPSPKMQEVKFLYQNIVISIEDGVAHIENRNLFTDTNEYKAVLRVQRTGVECLRDEFVIDCAPLSSVDYPLELELPTDDEYVVTLSFALKEDTLWAKAGHEVAYGQTTVGEFKPQTFEKGKLTVTEGFENIGIKGDNFEVLFTTAMGGLSSYRYNGKQYLKKTIHPNFWRPMTENDSANKLPFRAGIWKIASKYRSTWGSGITGPNPSLKTEESKVVVTYTYFLATNPSHACEVEYTVNGDGVIDVKLSMEKSDHIGELPEFSMMFTLDADFDRLEWYGKGPEETYWDKDHAKVDVYKNFVADNMAKYLVPQECGNKQDVRYAKVTKEDGEGILFVTKGLGFSALPYSPDDIDSATHAYELPRVHYTYVRVGKQMGIAGDDTWGAKTHPEFMLDNSKKMEIEFSFRGI